MILRFIPFFVFGYVSCGSASVDIASPPPVEELDDVSQPTDPPTAIPVDKESSPTSDPYDLIPILDDIHQGEILGFHDTSPSPASVPPNTDPPQNAERPTIHPPRSNLQ